MSDSTIPGEAIERLAKKLLDDYDSEYDASHLTWRDFAEKARENLEAAAPLIVAAELERAARLLRLCADGRREYANSAPEDASRMLHAEACALVAAARIVEGDSKPVFGLLPSWRWGEAGLPDPAPVAEARELRGEQR